MQLLRKIAFPISLIYAAVVHVRNLLYDLNIFESKSFKTPTICVGNLSVGGTGKTPMVEYLVALLTKEYKVAVLSRGYKRKSKGFVLASPNNTVEDIGDEPYQIHSKYNEVPVAVDVDRRNGISKLEELVKPDIIILDDAFQHRKVSPTISILLTSYGSLYNDDWYLPTGNLRDSKREARRAHIIIVTKCPHDLSEKAQKAMISKLRPRGDQMILFSCLKYSNVHSEKGVQTEVDSLKKMKITLVTGIANPEPLVEYLKNKGLLFEHLSFKDHYFFTQEDIEILNAKDYVLTTEKDYVRLKGRVRNLHYISVGHSFLNDGEAVLSAELKKSIKQC
ncbi:tetraacyldisaccharide 4'-kinase [Maribacter algicola]|uniref:Tetraacyldisaccharide 4'-kinase n=1 Tax=Meishania litoralis TaxID=3434685 RepID=A0ACC7LLR5_9FLAO